MKNRYEDSDYRQRWNNDNDNNWRNSNQFNNENRFGSNSSYYNRSQHNAADFDRENYNQPLSDRNYSDRGGNVYGRQYRDSYNSDRAQSYSGQNDVDRYNNNRSNDYNNNLNQDRNFQSRGDNNQDRGWWDKTTDEVSSWFGDEDAKRRRRRDEMQENNHRGKGPKNYTRSSDRIKEDVNDHLGDHWMLDASNIEVEVNGTEITLTGTVDSKENKRRAEDIADSVSGVTHVQNNLRVTRFSDNITNDDNTKATTANNYKTRKETLNHN